MKRSNNHRMKLMLVGLVAVIVLGGGSVRADVIWTQKADMPIQRYQHSASVVGGKIYVIGGWNAIGEWNPQWEALTRVDAYDPATNTWTRKADMPTGRGHTSACVVDGKIYVIGGDGDLGISAVEVYNPATDTWTQKADMPTRRINFSASVVDGIIYTIGGPGSGVVEAYDTTTDTWTTKTDRPTKSRFLATCVVDGLVYAIGGGAPGERATEVYDPATDAWTRKTSMPTARYCLDAVVACGKIYAIGGWWFSIGGPIYSTVEVYDTATDTWTEGVDIPVTTAGLSTCVVDGKIYVMGGATAPHDNNHWIFTSAVYANEPIVDLNGDGIVDATDMCIVVDNWGTDNPLCDIGPMPWGDGIVDIEDMKVLADYLFEDVNDPTLEAHWPLDETQGSTARDSVSGEGAFVMGDPLWQPSGGMVDGALQLDGVDDCVITTTGINPADGPFSVLAWNNGGAPGQAIISQQAVSDWLILDTKGSLMTELKSTGRPDGGSLLSDAIITDGDWHRVGVVWDGSYRCLYVDGAKVAKDTEPLSGLESANRSLYIGVGKDYTAGTFFSGLIDDIRIYNRVVSP